MSVPSAVRDHITEMLWREADRLDWRSLSDGERARYYEAWVKDSGIGGVLANYMDPRRIRVYIKDTLFKPYLRSKLEGTEGAVRRMLGVPEDVPCTEGFVKPHGRVLVGGGVFCWGSSRDWKQILMAVYERSVVSKGRFAVGAVLLEGGKSADSRTRDMIREAANRLKVGEVVWLD